MAGADEQKCSSVPAFLAKYSLIVIFLLQKVDN